MNDDKNQLKPGLNEDFIFRFTNSYAPGNFTLLFFALPTKINTFNTCFKTCIIVLLFILVYEAKSCNWC